MVCLYSKISIKLIFCFLLKLANLSSIHLAKLIAFYLSSAIILLLYLCSTIVVRSSIELLLCVLCINDLISLLFLRNFVIELVRSVDWLLIFSLKIDDDDNYSLLATYLRWSDMLNMISGLSIVSILERKLLALREINYCDWR